MKPRTSPIPIVKTPPIPRAHYVVEQQATYKPTDQQKWEKCCCESKQITELKNAMEDLRLQVADLRRMLHKTQDDVLYCAVHVDDLIKSINQ